MQQRALICARKLSPMSVLMARNDECECGYLRSLHAVTIVCDICERAYERNGVLPRRRAAGRVGPHWVAILPHSASPLSLHENCVVRC